MNLSNQVRVFSYLASVLADRESDPLCRSCSSFQERLTSVRESMSRFERGFAKEIESLPNEQSLLFFVARSRVSGIRSPVHPVSQKKSGGCSLPPGVCFLKHSHSILERIEQSGRVLSLARA